MIRTSDDPQAFARNEAASLWCMRLSEDALAPEAQRDFDMWITADSRNRDAFETMSQLWHGVEARADSPNMIRMRAEALDALHRSNQRAWFGVRMARRGWIGLAAAAMLALVLVTSFMLLGGSGKTYETGIGERRLVALEDGSRISLDAATRVRVQYEGDRRELRLLAGRAKFDVAHDPLRPFTVAAGDRVVVATGTSFSVELLQKKMHVILYEGKVDVLDADKARALSSNGRRLVADRVLTPGSEFVAIEGVPDAKVAPTDVDRSLSWESGQLNFRDEPMASAIERMNRYSARQLIVEDPAVARLLVDGVFAAGDTESFAEGVAAVLPLRAEVNENQIILRSRDRG